MILLPSMLVVLTNGLLSVPASHWRAIAVDVPSPGTQVEVVFETKSDSRVQALLLTAQEAERFHRGRRVEGLCSSGFQQESRLRCRVPVAGRHVLIIDNRIAARTPAMVQVRIDLRAPESAVVRELPPARQRLIVALSLAFFGAAVTFSAREFLKHHRRSGL